MTKCSMLTLCLAFTALTGCAAVTPPPERPRLYPAQTPIAGDLAVRVKRVGRHGLQIDNRTGTALGPGQIWLNHAYGRPFESIPTGVSGPYMLLEFVNAHRERYPTGSFLQPEKSRPVLLAELVLQGQRHKLVVDLEENWQKP